MTRGFPVHQDVGTMVPQPSLFQTASSSGTSRHPARGDQILIGRSPDNDIALSEGIDPALGFRLFKVETGFKGNARSSMNAYGYTQLQLPTARFYDRDVTVEQLFERETNLRIGFRFLRDLLEQFDHDMQVALVAYNRGPAKVAGILAKGGDPANGYAEAVMQGYQPLGSSAAAQ